MPQPETEGCPTSSGSLFYTLLYYYIRVIHIPSATLLMKHRSAFANHLLG